MYGTVAPGSCPLAGLGVGAGASVYCGHISSFHCYKYVNILLFLHRVSVAYIYYLVNTNPVKA